LHKTGADDVNLIIGGVIAHEAEEAEDTEEEEEDTPKYPRFTQTPDCR
jgi:hypothetical protein